MCYLATFVTALLLSLLPSQVFALSNSAEASEIEAVEEDVIPLSEMGPFEYYRELNSGWPRALEPIQQRLDPEKNYFTMILKPPSSPLDLRDGESLRGSLEFGGFAKTTIGHTMIAWQCQTPRGVVRGATGHTGESGGQIRNMVKDGWGVTAFVSTFTDGHLQEKNELDDVIAPIGKNGELYHLTVEIEEMGCAEMRRFLLKFLSHPDLPFSRFGLLPDPSQFEGGGCGSTAVAFADKAGAFQPMTTHVWRTMRAPHQWMGRRQTIPEEVDPYWVARSEREEYKVGMNSFMEGPWRDDGQGGVDVRLVDPELLIYMAILSYEKFLENIRHDYSYHQQMKNYFNVERRLVRKRYRVRVPFEFYEETRVGFDRIDKDFSVETENMHQAVTKWWAGLQSHGARVEPAFIYRSPGLIIHR